MAVTVKSFTVNVFTETVLSYKGYMSNIFLLLKSLV